MKENLHKYEKLQYIKMLMYTVYVLFSKRLDKQLLDLWISISYNTMFGKQIELIRQLIYPRMCISSPSHRLLATIFTDYSYEVIASQQCIVSVNWPYNAKILTPQYLKSFLVNCTHNFYHLIAKNRSYPRISLCSPGC